MLPLWLPMAVKQVFGGIEYLFDRQDELDSQARANLALRHRGKDFTVAEFTAEVKRLRGERRRREHAEAQALQQAAENQEPNWDADKAYGGCVAVVVGILVVAMVIMKLTGNLGE